MQIVFHLGTHFSDEGRLLRALAANAGPLEAQGCIVPPPARYREPIRELLNALRGAPADATAQETLLDTITEHDDFARLILSHENFMGFPVQVVSPQGFHAQAGQRLQALCNLFPGAEIEFFMALVNPATLMPAIVRFAQRKYSYDQIMAGQPPEDLRWAPVVREMLDAIGGRKLVLWCNEDTPLIWPEVLRRIALQPPEAAFDGDFAVLAAIMAPEGLERLKAYLASHPPKTPLQRRKIVSAFLDKYGLPDRIEVEVPLPGWTEELVELVTARYEADVTEIAALPGVEFLAP